MSNPRKAYRRKQFFSNPRVQSKIILTFAFLAVLYAATNYYIAKSTLWSFSADVLQLSLTEDSHRDVELLMQQQDSTLDLQLGLFTLLVITVITLGGIVMSHRLGGPIYQLQKYLREITAGTVEPRHIRFRKNDFFHDLASAFNTFQENQGIVSSEEKKDPHD